VGILVSAQGMMALMFQGNDFSANTIGMTLWGFGGSLGTIDLGGGFLGSKGQNSFLGFTPAATAAGHCAIRQHETAPQKFTILAHDNIWSTGTPDQVVRDGWRNTLKPEDLPGFHAGTGYIDLGIPPIDPNGGGLGVQWGDIDPKGVGHDVYHDP